MTLSLVATAENKSFEPTNCMPIFPTISQDQSRQFNNFALGRRGPLFPTQVAPLQSRLPAAMVRDQYEEAEATSAGLAPLVDYSMSDPELVRSQWGRGGSAVGEMFGGPAPKLKPGGGMDYTGIKPIRGGSEELLSNPKFLQIARYDPRKAAVVYKAITGRDMGNDFQEKQKMDAMRQKEMSDTIRSGVMRGDLRQNPETGFVERKASVPDPKNPMQKIDAWETMDAEAQLAMTSNWERAMGAKQARSNPLATLQMPPQQKALVMANYMRLVQTGQMAPREALTEAIKMTPGGDAGSGAPPTASVSTPHAASASPPPKDPAAYQRWMTQQMGQRNTAISGAVATGAGKLASYGVDAIDAGSGMLDRGGEVLASVGASVPNLVNQAIMGVTGSPAWDWMRPARDMPAPPAYQMPRSRIDDRDYYPDFGHGQIRRAY